MENLTSAISVQVDSHDKEAANDILKNLGLNMSTFVNMAIKQLLYTNGLPFEVKNPIHTDNNSTKTEILDFQKTTSKKKEEQDGNNYNYYTMPNLVEYLNND